MLKHLAVVAGVVVSTASVTVANAAVVAGSQVQFFGSAFISAAGNISPAFSLIFSAGNVGPAADNQGYLGYNSPNPAAGPFYTANIANIPAIMGAPFTAITMPAIVLGGGETGPAQEATSFLLRTWAVTQATIGGFFTARGTGDIFATVGGGFLSAGDFQFTTQFFTPSASDTQTFSATLTAVPASVIPVPGAAWIFGSGLLLMTAVMRRKSS